MKKLEFHANDHSLRLEVVRLCDQRATAHVHEFFELIFLEEAHGIHRVGSHLYPAKSGDLYLIAPGELHDPSGLEHAQGWMVLFGEEVIGVSSLSGLHQDLRLLSFLRFNHRSVGQIHLQEESKERWTSWSQALHLELQQKRLGYPIAAKAILDLMLVDASRLTHDQLGDMSVSHRPLITRVFNDIEEHFTEEISLSFLAQRVQRSGAHLTALMRRETGKTVLEWIIARRLFEVRRLLLETEKPLSWIADRVGYNETSYLIKHFKRHFGLTPHQWRLKNR